VVRRNGSRHRKRSPSTTRGRSTERRSCNGVRIKSSDTTENAYEIASARNGTARPSPNSAPPTGGPAISTAAVRACWTPAASGSCTAGTTERNAPAAAGPKKAAFAGDCVSASTSSG
jgi:hypothetical protein